ncbi:MAG TPA: ribonuclease HI family protein [Actinomycetota bacterium]
MRLLSADPHPHLILHTDGAARGNPGPAGIGAVLTDPSGRTVATLAQGVGVATNNQAEYRAVIEGLRLATERGAKRVLVRSDSKLLVEQLAGRFRVKNPTLQRLHEEVRALVRTFDRVDFEHVRREENAEADALANEGVDAWLAGPGSGYEAADPRPPELFEE